ncbi:MAG: hypothetical protein IH623_32405 [Verrucomicrobia bacterium]|nr:hypothetical protein [Verrucomicrobiota bacterium]
MSDEIAALKQEIKVLKNRVEELEKEHGTISVYLKSTEPNIKKAILSLVEALARVAHGAPHLTPEDQTTIKKLLGIG